MSAPAACAARKRFLPIRPNPLIPADTAIGSSFRMSFDSAFSVPRSRISGPLANPSVYNCRTRMLGGTMKRLVTLMLACAAIIVMAIAATGARADHGADDNTPATAQPCDVRQGDDNGTDSRVVRAADDGTSGDDSQEGTSGDDNISGRA